MKLHEKIRHIRKNVLKLSLKDFYKKLENIFGDKAVTYYATDIVEVLQPYCWYKHHVLAGAAEFNLPTDYVTTIEAVEMVVDEDADRRTKEIAPYF